MKCLRNPITGEIRRVHEAEGRKLASYGWQYVTKGEWKKTIRPNLSVAKQGAKQAAEGLVQGQGIRRI